MIEIKETTMEDLKNVRRLCADGDVMRFVGFPKGRSAGGNIRIPARNCFLKPSGSRRMRKRSGVTSFWMSCFDLIKAHRLPDHRPMEGNR